MMHGKIKNVIEKMQGNVENWHRPGMGVKEYEEWKREMDREVREEGGSNPIVE